MPFHVISAMAAYRYSPYLKRFAANGVQDGQEATLKGISEHTGIDGRLTRMLRYNLLYVGAAFPLNHCFKAHFKAKKKAHD